VQMEQMSSFSDEQGALGAQQFLVNVLGSVDTAQKSVEKKFLELPKGDGWSWGLEEHRREALLRSRRTEEVLADIRGRVPPVWYLRKSHLETCNMKLALGVGIVS